MCLLCCKRSPRPTSRSRGECAEGRVGRKEQADFPTGASLVPLAPTDGPTRTDVSFALHVTVRSFPSQFQAPLSMKSDTKTLVHSNEKEKTVQIPIVGENTEHFDSNTPKTGVQITSVIWGGSNDHQVKGRNTQPHPELCNRGENCV